MCSLTQLFLILVLSNQVPVKILELARKVVPRILSTHYVWCDACDFANPKLHARCLSLQSFIQCIHVPCLWVVQFDLFKEHRHTRDEVHKYFIKILCAIFLASRVLVGLDCVS